MASSSIQKGEFLGASMLEHSHLIKTWEWLPSQLPNSTGQNQVMLAEWLKQ
jgi:hypothetical protein